MSHRILVVDDEHSMCEFMQIMLGKEGYEVDAEQDGRTLIPRRLAVQRSTLCGIGRET